MFKKAITIIALLCFTHVGLATAAKIYKWKDEKGTIHFSDNPPRQHETVKNLATEKYTPVKQTAAQIQQRKIDQYRKNLSTQAYVARQEALHKYKRRQEKYEANIKKINDEYNEQKVARYKANIQRYETAARHTPSLRHWYKQQAEEEKTKLQIHEKYH
jgi:hypothetical protein